MFLIFGWGHQTIKEHGPVNKYHCEHCKNEERWKLLSRRSWITLFFIPVIPYSTEHLMLCPICSYGVKLDGEKFNELRPIAECNTDLINKRITQDEYSRRITQLTSVEIQKEGLSNRDKNTKTSKISDDLNMHGKTETQLNYLRQMREIEEERERKRLEVETDK